MDTDKIISRIGVGIVILLISTCCFVSVNSCEPRPMNETRKENGYSVRYIEGCRYVEVNGKLIHKCSYHN